MSPSLPCHFYQSIDSVHSHVSHMQWTKNTHFYDITQPKICWHNGSVTHMLEEQIFFYMHRNVFQRTSAVCRRGVLSVSVARNDRVGALVMVSLQSLSIHTVCSLFFPFHFIPFVVVVLHLSLLFCHSIHRRRVNNSYRLTCVWLCMSIWNEYM